MNQGKEKNERKTHSHYVEQKTRLKLSEHICQARAAHGYAGGGSGNRMVVNINTITQTKRELRHTFLQCIFNFYVNSIGEAKKKKQFFFQL